MWFAGPGANNNHKMAGQKQKARKPGPSQFNKVKKLNLET
jgi:hypothetical protein